MYDTASPWRKSRRSYSSGGCVETAAWRKPRRSMANGNCAEVGQAAAVVLVRDSRDRSGPVLAFTADTWTRFTRDPEAALARA